jgi:anti-anti-sigma factor
MGDEMNEVRDRESSRSGEHWGSFAVYADPAILLHLSGELEAASASTLASALDPLTTRGGVVGLDLAELTFMDSTGINALCQAKQRLGEQGRIVLINPPPPVLRVIEIAGLSGIFE